MSRAYIWGEGIKSTKTTWLLVAKTLIDIDCFSHISIEGNCLRFHGKMYSNDVLIDYTDHENETPWDVMQWLTRVLNEG